MDLKNKLDREVADEEGDGKPSEEDRPLTPTVARLLFEIGRD
jgi:hypothetical protein